jgi:uncharacterized protein YabE (DUF348 family)/3D (Asp-Asp-Asp) domain-containing protein
MGGIPIQETHEESLSGMSYAWRWARAHKKALLSVTAGVIAGLCLFTGLVYGTQMKRVTVVADGSTQQFVTMKATVKQMLEEHGVKLGAHDIVSTPLHAEVQSGMELSIARAFPVQVMTDGEIIEVYTVAADVKDVLQAAGITLGPLDKIEPSLGETLTSESKIKIVRVERILEETEHKLPFETVKQEDKNLLKGKEKVVQEGQEGVLVKRVEKVYEDGVLVSEQVVGREVEEESLAKIVAVGTKAKPKPKPKPISNAVAVLSSETQEITLDGITIGVKGVLKNVTLTAYSAGFASTGKRKGDRGYGITASGTTVSEGRTIAVDTNVIPMGWWVYIDGVGFRRAEDKGSAVKGKKIDVYFDSESYAQKFGTKKGYTVYVIGPKKPVAN